MSHKLPFDQWMKKVDDWLYRKIGLTSEGLPDFCYWDCWNAGYSPGEAAEAAFDYMQEC